MRSGRAIRHSESCPPVAAETESVPCPLCGERASRDLLRGEGWRMVACKGCGFVRQNPRVTAAWIRRLEYDVNRRGVIAPRRSRGVDAAALEGWETKPRGAYTAAVRAVTGFMSPATERGIWLDVGCQTGGMLAAAKAEGFTAAGCDVDGGAARFAREQHGADVRTGTLAEAAFEQGSAAVMSYQQVLEHVHNLRAELNEVRRVLAPGGILLVEVPNMGGIRYRLRALFPFIRRRRLFHNLPQHLYYFRFRDLERLLASHGFEVVGCGTYGRFRPRRSLVRRCYDRARDRLRLGNKLRVIARRQGA